MTTAAYDPIKRALYWQKVRVVVWLWMGFLVLSNAFAADLSVDAEFGSTVNVNHISGADSLTFALLGTDPAPISLNGASGQAVFTLMAPQGFQVDINPPASSRPPDG